MLFLNTSLSLTSFKLSRYKPYINYDWSTTTAKEYKTDGVELVINGGFDTDLSGWINTNSYWQWNNGMVYHPDGTVNNGLSQGNKAGLLTFDTEVISGVLAVEFNGVTTYYTESGTYSIYSEAETFLKFKRFGSFHGYLDNISVQKVIQEPNKRYLKDVGSTPTYNASMYFGRGAYLNGVDQTITVPINTTIQTALKRVNGVVTINETSQTLTNYVISGLGVHKDYYLFTRLLTTAEKDSYTNTPETFYAMAQADSTCVLNMPMCETSSTARNHKTGIDYPITNYTTSVRDNAKNLQYGLQTCKFVRDSLGVIQSASQFLEGDGTGYVDTGWIPPTNKDFTIECIIYLKPNLTFQQNGSGNLHNAKIHFGLWNDNRPYIQGRSPSAFYGTVLTNPTSMYFSIVKSGTINKLYMNNNLIASESDSQIGESMPFLLGKRASYISYSPIRLFKVHDKALTQEEITKNYNSYVAKGLLA